MLRRVALVTTNETSVLTKATRRNISDDGILQHNPDVSYVPLVLNIPITIRKPSIVTRTPDNIVHCIYVIWNWQLTLNLNGNFFRY
jgi:hypothetical protein